MDTDRGDRVFPDNVDGILAEKIIHHTRSHSGNGRRPKKGRPRGAARPDPARPPKTAAGAGSCCCADMPAAACIGFMVLAAVLALIVLSRLAKKGHKSPVPSIRSARTALRIFRKQNPRGRRSFLKFG